MSKRILISIPLSPYSRLEPKTVIWLIKQIVHWNYHNPGQYCVSYVLEEGKPIDSVRNKVINNFLKTDNDYLMVLDADIVPPDNCIEELMNHQVDVIGATVFSFQHGYPFAVTLDKVSTGYKQSKLNGQRLHECDATGAACMIIKRKVLEDMKKYLLNETGKTMFYETHFDIQGEISCGQDFSFCNRVLELGYKIFIDTKILCGHYVDRMDILRVNTILVNEQQKVFEKDKIITQLKQMGKKEFIPEQLVLPLENNEVIK